MHRKYGIAAHINALNVGSGSVDGRSADMGVDAASIRVNVYGV